MNSAAPFVGRIRRTLPNTDVGASCVFVWVCECVSASVGSPVCIDSLNKHKKKLFKKFPSPSLCWCMCVWCDNTSNISLILPLDIRALICFIPIIGCSCRVCLLHGKRKHCGCCWLLCVLRCICVLAALLNIVWGAVAPCWLWLSAYRPLIHAKMLKCRFYFAIDLTPH